MSLQRVLAINQAWHGSAGTLVANSSQYFEAPTAHGAGGKIKPGDRGDVRYPAWQVWSKPMAAGRGRQTAVLVINLSEQAQSVEVSYAALGLRPNAGESVAASDAWTGAAVTRGIGKTGLQLAAIRSHDSVFLVLALDEL